MNDSADGNDLADGFFAFVNAIHTENPTYKPVVITNKLGDKANGEHTQQLNGVVNC